MGKVQQKLTSTANTPLAGPDVKTAARFRRRCGKRYVSHDRTVI